MKFKKSALLAALVASAFASSAMAANVSPDRAIGSAVTPQHQQAQHTKHHQQQRTLEQSRYHGVKQSRYNGAKQFNQTDANNDGIISRNEFSAKADKYFNAMDTDNSGSLSREEVRRSAHVANKNKRADKRADMSQHKQAR